MLWGIGTFMEEVMPWGIGTFMEEVMPRGMWENFGGKDALGACGTNQLGT